jgi:peptide/nickel transport system substrate-binding protein
VEPVKNGPGVLLYLMFNHQQGPTSDINIRRAFQAMVDPSEITSMVVSDSSFSLVNSSIYAPESVFSTDFDSRPARSAQEYLAESEYNGEPIFVQVIATDITQQRIAVALVEQAKRVGLNLQIRSYDLSTWVARRQDPAAMNTYPSAGYWVDPSLWHPEFSGSFPSREVGFSSSVTDNIFADLASATDLEQRKSLGRDLQNAFYDQVALVNLGYVYRLVAKTSRVQDPHGNLALGNLTLHGVWLAQ